LTLAKVRSRPQRQPPFERSLEVSCQSSRDRGSGTAHLRLTDSKKLVDLRTNTSPPRTCHRSRVPYENGLATAARVQSGQPAGQAERDPTGTPKAGA
jgi:hypothetical protein